MICRRWLAAVGLWGLLVGWATAAPYAALVIDGQGQQHDWRRTTALLKKHLEDTGLFAVDVLTSPPQGSDMSGFRPKFADYHVAVMNYGYRGDPWPRETEMALEDYMAGGGGLVIYHAAASAHPKWKAYNEMAGLGGWDGRNEKDGPYVYWKDGRIVHDTTPGEAGSHGPQHEFALVVRAPDHPVTGGLPPAFMHSADELYNRFRGPARNLTVLCTAFSPPDKAGTDRHEPVLIAVQYGKGRVFHTMLGHAPEQLRSVAFIVTFQRGTEWAASGKVTQEIPDDFPGPDRPSVRE